MSRFEQGATRRPVQGLGTFNPSVIGIEAPGSGLEGFRPDTGLQRALSLAGQFGESMARKREQAADLARRLDAQEAAEDDRADRNIREAKADERRRQADLEKQERELYEGQYYGIVADLRRESNPNNLEAYLAGMDSLPIQYQAQLLGEYNTRLSTLTRDEDQVKANTERHYRDLVLRAMNDHNKGGSITGLTQLRGFLSENPVDNAANIRLIDQYVDDYQKKMNTQAQIDSRYKIYRAINGVVNEVLERNPDGLSPETLTDEVVVGLSESTGIPVEELLAPGLDGLVYSAATQAYSLQRENQRAVATAQQKRAEAEFSRNVRLNYLETGSLPSYIELIDALGSDGANALMDEILDSWDSSLEQLERITDPDQFIETWEVYQQRLGALLENPAVDPIQVNAIATEMQGFIPKVRDFAITSTLQELSGITDRQTLELSLIETAVSMGLIPEDKALGFATLPALAEAVAPEDKEFVQRMARFVDAQVKKDPALLKTKEDVVAAAFALPPSDNAGAVIDMFRQWNYANGKLQADAFGEMAGDYLTRRLDQFLNVADDEQRGPIGAEITSFFLSGQVASSAISKALTTVMEMPKDKADYIATWIREQSLPVMLEEDQVTWEDLVTRGSETFDRLEDVEYTVTQAMGLIREDLGQRYGPGLVDEVVLLFAANGETPKDGTDLLRRIKELGHSLVYSNSALRGTVLKTTEDQLATFNNATSVDKQEETLRKFMRNKELAKTYLGAESFSKGLRDLIQSNPRLHRGVTTDDAEYTYRMNVTQESVDNGGFSIQWQHPSLPGVWQDVKSEDGQILIFDYTDIALSKAARKLERKVEYEQELAAGMARFNALTPGSAEGASYTPGYVTPPSYVNEYSESLEQIKAELIRRGHTLESE